ncbi:hypothetical protein R1flu_026770 [Riccia fluitans]|uniref:Uncharacterized protein n=1 Tax=Riccia fluitans TaxID=41844 RepID=A0ABD1XGV8_9MARC
MLAATKTQLSEECMHTRELQERLGKIESDGRDAVKKAVRKAQDQAERDLVAIKRQHSQIVQSLQNRISKLQKEHAKSIVAYHQLERRLSQQQQEFVHTLNQRDNEFRKSLDAKEIEVNAFLDEQNALLNELKKFWRPILNSSPAKIFIDKSQRSHLHSPTSSSSEELKREEGTRQVQTARSSQGSILKETALEAADRRSPSSEISVGSKTVVANVKSENREKTTKPEVSRESEQDKKKEQRDVMESRPKTTGSLNVSRLSTLGRKIKPDPKVKKNENDLISTYLHKQQTSYVSSNKQNPQFKSSMNTRSLDLLLENNGQYETPNNPQNRHDDGRLQAEAGPVSRQFPAFSDCDSEALPQYICVPPEEVGVRNSIYTTPRKRQTAENSTSALQEKLENLEALSETLLGQRM